jgi:hypothetical protein
MKNGRKSITAVLVGVLLVTLVFPLTNASTSSRTTGEVAPVHLETIGDWTYIQNDLITIVFPANGTKPMFLWWYTKDPVSVNVVKYKGLLEYMTFNQPYFTLKSQADALTMREMAQARFYEPRHSVIQKYLRIMAWQTLLEIGNYSDLHRPFLPFSACKWELSALTNVTQGDVKYLGFNFTLVDVPANMPNLQFAENNIIIRCRFYYTPATINVEGQHNYSVAAGEFKMDFVVKHWVWNIDKINTLLQTLSNALNVTIPQGKGALALWINLASIPLTKLDTSDATSDAVDANDGGIETMSTTQNMYVEGQKVSVAANMTAKDAQPVPNRMTERFKFRFTNGNATLAGFFKFVPQALIRNPTNGTVMRTVDVTASYIAAGAHMRVYIGYPYFGNNELEHDPSLGLETLPTLAIYGLTIALLGISTIIAVALMALRWRKRSVNMLKPN